MAKAKKIQEEKRISKIFTNKQLDLMRDYKSTGLSYSQIGKKIHGRVCTKKETAAISTAFRNHITKFLEPKEETHDESQKRKTIEKIHRVFLEMVEKENKIPTSKNIRKKAQLGAHTLEHNCGSIEQLTAELREKHPEKFEKIIDQNYFTDEDFDKIKAKLKGKKRFIVVSAVTNCEPFKGALKAVNTWKNHYGKEAEILVMPCSDPAKKVKGGSKQFQLHPEFAEMNIIYKDLWLNENIYLSSIEMSAKAIKPLTGMQNIGQRHGSFVYASPQQTLLHLATKSADTHKAIATPGAITMADYETDKYISRRTARIADENHTYGGMVIEIRDDKAFHIRHFQFDEKDGSFRDIDKEFTPGGKVNKISIELLATGDFHVTETDEIAEEATRRLALKLSPKFMTVEDFFSGNSINLHEKNSRVLLANKHQEGLMNLRKELEECHKKIEELLKWNIGKIVFKYGNHEDFLARYLENENYNPENRHMSIKLEDAFLEKNMPFQWAMEKYFGISEPDRCIWLKTDDIFEINGVECGAHGHLGPNGKRNPGLDSMATAYSRVTHGHNHSGALWRGVVRVGTMSKLRLSYNKGPSSWTHSNCIQHYNGSRQLITIINGKSHLDDK